MSNELTSGLTAGGTFYVASREMDGRTPLLLLMGYSGTVDSWSAPFLARLAAVRPIIAVDLPGNGRATRELQKERLSYDEVTRDLEATLDHFGVETAHVLGYSYGGTIAMRFARARPARVATLTLVATTLGGSDYVSPPKAILAELGAPPGTTVDEKTEVIWRICLGADKLEHFTAHMRATLDKQRDSLTPGWVLREQLKNYLGFSFAAEAATMGLPVLALTGDEDPLTPAENSRRIAAAFPRSTLTMLPGCRHMPHLEEPERFAAAVLAFTARHEAAP